LSSQTWLIPRALQLYESTLDVLPHATWCATGPLAFLPIHAAGEYETLGEGGLKVSDFVVSSYTATLSALLQPPLVIPPDLQSPSTKILVVSQPDTPGCSPLPSVREEVASLKRHFAGDAVIHLDRTEATVDVAKLAMSEHGQIVHLACHGVQDIFNPRESAFLLHDGKLTLSQIMQSQSSNTAALAFLSACQTATGDAKLPDEAVHLAAGMLSAGYRSVVGTMWPIGDEDAPLIADEFYRRLKEYQGESGGRLKAAYALHDAVKLLRDSVGEGNVMRWAPFVHFGIV
jgi:CHAT domain-containing protein